MYDQEFGLGPLPPLEDQPGSEITSLWINDDRVRIAVELDNGDGGLLDLDTTFDPVSQRDAEYLDQHGWTELYSKPAVQAMLNQVADLCGGEVPTTSRGRWNRLDEIHELVQKFLSRLA